MSDFERWAKRLASKPAKLAEYQALTFQLEWASKILAAFLFIGSIALLAVSLLHIQSDTGPALVILVLSLFFGWKAREAYRFLRILRNGEIQFALIVPYEAKQAYRFTQRNSGKSSVYVKLTVKVYGRAKFLHTDLVDIELFELGRFRTININTPQLSDVQLKLNTPYVLLQKTNLKKAYSVLDYMHGTFAESTSRQFHTISLE